MEIKSQWRDKEFFLLHLKDLEIINDLTDKQIATLLKTIIYYQLNGKLPKIETIIKIIITPFINQFKKDEEKHKKIIEIRSKMGKSGGKNKSKYHQYLHSEKWENIKNTLFNIRGKNCEKCTNTKYLQVHHLTYKHLYNEIVHLEDLIILCKTCHKKEHNLI